VLPFVFGSRLAGRVWGALPNGIIDPTSKSGEATPASSNSLAALLEFAAAQESSQNNSAGSLGAIKDGSIDIRLQMTSMDYIGVFGGTCERRLGSPIAPNDCL